NGKLTKHSYKVAEQVELALKSLVWDKIAESISGEDGDSESRKYITEWAGLLNQPIPDIKRAAMDIEVLSEEDRLPDAKKSENEIIAVSFVGSDGLNEVLVLNHGNETGNNKMEDHIKVRFFDGEKEMLLAVFDRILDYPFILTFNGDDFDMPYIYNRAMNLGIVKDEIPITLQRDAATLKHGVHIDLYRTLSNRSIQGYAFGHKYTEFTLNAVSEALINESKIEFEGGIGELPLYELARYCHNDSRLTYKLTSFNDDLLMKLLVVVCRVGRMPIDDISRLGVSQWIRSMLYFEHRRQDALIPQRGELELKSQASTTAVIKDKKYRGGFVVEPKAGVHFSVAVLDFASLYPSIIKVHNLSYETVRCVHEECRTNMIPETEHWACRKRKGMESLLIGSLRDLRVNYYKHLAKDKTLSKEEKALYNIISQALKVILNASYGVMGAEIFPLYCLPVAEATASIGRFTITKTIEKCQELGIEVVYGDSITGDRFVTVLNDRGLIEIKKISELFENCMVGFARKDGKEVAFPSGLYALSINTATKRPAFEPISAVIRHKVNKNICRVNQKWGETVVTEDHSLIVESDGKLVPAKPLQMKEKDLIRIEQIPRVREIKILDVYDILREIEYQVRYKGRTKIINVHADGDWVWFGWTNRKDPIKVKRYMDIESREF
ncbi:MAG: DNA polymerase domain-containing protein, partial [Nitrososphaerales archaeon]